jgi:hypothetical protein
MDFRGWALALLAGMALAACGRGDPPAPPAARGEAAVMGAQPGVGLNSGLGGTSGLGLTGSFPATTSTHAGIQR